MTPVTVTCTVCTLTAARLASGYTPRLTLEIDTQPTQHSHGVNSL